MYNQNVISFGSFTYTQRYRSGHNGAVSKTVGPHGHVGSNPTRCAKCEYPSPSGGGYLHLVDPLGGFERER